MSPGSTGRSANLLLVSGTSDPLSTKLHRWMRLQIIGATSARAWISTTVPGLRRKPLTATESHNRNHSRPTRRGDPAVVNHDALHAARIGEVDKCRFPPNPESSNRDMRQQEVTANLPSGWGLSTHCPCEACAGFMMLYLDVGPHPSRENSEGLSPASLNLLARYSLRTRPSVSSCLLERYIRTSPPTPNLIDCLYPPPRSQASS